MAVTFKGNGLVYIPSRNRFIRFVNGEYSTADADEIAVLAREYAHDVEYGKAPEVAKERKKPGPKPKAVKNV